MLSIECPQARPEAVAHGDMHAVNSLVPVISNECIGVTCIVNSLAHDKPSESSAKANVLHINT